MTEATQQAHEGAPDACPACSLVADPLPRWTVERRPWPEGWPALGRPYRVTLDGAQIAVYGSAGEAMAAIPEGETVLQVTLEGHRRIVVKGNPDDEG